MTDRSRDNLLRLSAVRTRTSLSRTTIYKKIAAGTFPPSTPISDGLVAWYQSDIDAWVSSPMTWSPIDAPDAPPPPAMP
jgi:prophage regulatory protein